MGVPTFLNSNNRSASELYREMCSYKSEVPLKLYTVAHGASVDSSACLLLDLCDHVQF